MIGTTLLNYLVGAELGSGGLGTVYRGEHSIIGRKVALKVLNPQVSHDPAMVARFLAEARAVNAIRHPNIVEVTDYGQDGQIFVIVMELLEGETVAQRLERVQQFDEPEALSILTQVASAMGAAHERGIVHRDLKPENVFLTQFADYPDFVKVLDFGIAKLSGELQSAARTSPGLIMGTPAYMSPEQCTGDTNLDLRSDVYSLGVMAYRFVGGRLPYPGTNPMQVMHGHVNGQAPKLRSLNPNVSVEFERLVEKCMSKAPSDRYDSMIALRRLLASMGGKQPIAFSREEMGEPEPKVGRTTNVATQAPAEADDATQQTLVRPSKATTPNKTEEQRLKVDIVMTASKVREVLAEKLKGNSLKLPALPEVAVSCLELAHDPDVKFSALASVIERDPFIASRVVRLGNSAMFGGLARVTSVEGAVARLGIRSLVTLLQELAAEQVFVSRDPVIRDAFRGIWAHCLGVATLARDLATITRGTNPNTAYLAGLFHDIGKPVVGSLLLEQERGAKKGHFRMAAPVWLGVVEELYRDVGAILALRWFLPREVANAIAAADVYDLRRGRFSAANMVRLANALCAQEGLDSMERDPLNADRAILQGRQVLQLRAEQLTQVTNGIVERVAALTEQQDENNATRVFDRGSVQL